MLVDAFPLGQCRTSGAVWGRNEETRLRGAKQLAQDRTRGGKWSRDGISPSQALSCEDIMEERGQNITGGAAHPKCGGHHGRGPVLHKTDGLS